MLQQEKSDDYVIATGKSHSIREFVELAFKEVDIEIEWQGKGINEKGLNSANGETLIEIDPKYFRPSEVDHLQGDFSKAEKKLGWKPKTNLEELVQIMVQYDLKHDVYGHD